VVGGPALQAGAVIVALVAVEMAGLAGLRVAILECASRTGRQTGPGGRQESPQHAGSAQRQGLAGEAGSGALGRHGGIVLEVTVDRQTAQSGNFECPVVSWATTAEAVHAAIAGVAIISAWQTTVGVA
jgi:hypothetical protein